MLLYVVVDVRRQRRHDVLVGGKHRTTYCISCFMHLDVCEK